MRWQRRSCGQKLLVVQAHTDSELEAAFVTLVQQRAGALLVGPDPFFLRRRDKLVELAAHQKLPAIYTIREFAMAGGLMSYGTSITEAHRIAGLYAGRNLRAKSRPICQFSSPQKSSWSSISKPPALGLTVPPQIVARADEVIE